MLIPLSSKIKEVIKPSVFLGGLCEDNNEWRKEIIKKFNKDLSFIDPFDKKWSPEENIYTELEDICTADYVVFYKGGEGTKKEKKFMKKVDKEYKEFTDLDKLKEYLKRI